MAKLSVITTKGLSLLHSANAAGENSYWIGYFGLAYVPSENKATGKSDELKSDMTVLTQTGDYIYNIWQGSMPTKGYTQKNGDSDTAAKELYGLSSYTSNITSRFRYVVDDDGNNNLVMWKSTADGDSTVSGAAVYQGATKDTVSKMPIPAPLFYMGEPVEYSSPRTESEFVAEVKKADGIADFPVKDGRPSVSSDPRSYLNSNTNLPLNGPDDSSWGLSFNAGKYEWASARSTYNQNGDGGDRQVIGNEKHKYCDQYWKYQSISNYNRFHAPATAEGYSVDYEPACRNMAKATRLFPVAHYEVLNTIDNMESPLNTKLVGSMKYTLAIDVADMFNTTAERAMTVVDTESDIKKDGESIYSAKECSFKFNRIGLYAVPMKIYRFYGQDNIDEAKNQSVDYRVQFEIQGDAEPVLFAVVDLPNTITLSESGGSTSYTYELTVNMSEADTAGSVIRDAGIFYNMYEHDAITWYKEQLIASASMSNAITDLGIEMNYLKNQIASASGSRDKCGGSVDMSDLYALKNHTHDYMKNIVDSSNDGNYAVKGIDTQAECTTVEYKDYDYQPQEAGMIGYSYLDNYDGADRMYFITKKSDAKV